MTTWSSVHPNAAGTCPGLAELASARRAPCPCSPDLMHLRETSQGGVDARAETSGHPGQRALETRSSKPLARPGV